MQIDKLVLVNQNQIQLLVASGRYKANVIYLVAEASFAIVLYDTDEECYTHILSFTQRQVEGRKADPKLYKSYPGKDLEKMDLLQDHSDLVLVGDVGL